MPSGAVAWASAAWPVGDRKPRPGIDAVTSPQAGSPPERFPAGRPRRRPRRSRARGGLAGPSPNAAVHGAAVATQTSQKSNNSRARVRRASLVARDIGSRCPDLVNGRVLPRSRELGVQAVDSVAEAPDGEPVEAKEARAVDNDADEAVDADARAIYSREHDGRALFNQQLSRRRTAQCRGRTAERTAKLAVVQPAAMQALLLQGRNNHVRIQEPNPAVVTRADRARHAAPLSPIQLAETTPSLVALRTLARGAPEGQTAAAAPAAPPAYRRGRPAPPPCTPAAATVQRGNE